MRTARGFTLVELMVSVVISLLLVLFVSSLYISSKGSYRINDDNARLQEDGSYAMNLIGRNLMQAGFGNVVNTGIINPTDFVGPDVNGVRSLGIRGCDGGFTSPAASTPKFTCAAGGTPALETNYRTGAYDANTGAGTDCNGQSVAAAADPYMVNNRFYLDGAGNLSCAGNGNTTPQPILSNVDAMVFTYGVDTNGDFVPDSYLNAAGVAALGLSATNKLSWNQVVSVQVCLTVGSANSVTPQPQTYKNCSGTDVTATDRRLRTTLIRVFTLRNNAAPSLL